MSVEFLLKDLPGPHLLGVNLPEGAGNDPRPLQILVAEGPPPDDLHQGGQVDGGGQMELLHHLQSPAQSPELLVIQNQLLGVLGHLPLQRKCRMIVGHRMLLPECTSPTLVWCGD